MLWSLPVPLLALFVTVATQVRGPGSGVQEGGPSPEPFAAVHMAIEEAIEAGKIPGAVLLIGQGEKDLVLRSYGSRSLVPEVEAMTVDTVFDLASLTKPIVTATSIMALADRGMIDLDAPVSRYLPEFGGAGKGEITIRSLLLHRGGLIPDNPLSDYQDGATQAWSKICQLSPEHPPGGRFVYTDVGYIVLGALVSRLDGRTLERFFREVVSGPLGMVDTGFGAQAGDCAPTELGPDGKPLRGVVHDPRARALGGVAGHAGLFATAEDVGRWCRMILGGGPAVLSSQALAEMSRGCWLPDGSGGRTVALDVDTAFSSARGLIFPRGSSFGHTGFTGTSLWIDPGSDSFVVLLTNRVHPGGGGSVVGLRRVVATEAARVLRPRRLEVGVLAGADVLAVDPGRYLGGARVGLITNHTGRTLGGVSTVDVLSRAEDVDLVSILSPEHGYHASLEGAVADATDPGTQLPIYSLYGKSRRPTAEMLAGVDTLVFDIQGAGVRFYTYATTLGYAMEAAADLGLRVVVLDRPNPLGGLRVDGPSADLHRQSFICYRPIPAVHGMTMGELAVMNRDVFGVTCELEIVRMAGWRRGMAWEDTGLPWVPPSPNLRNPTQAILYPAIGLLEGSNLAVGRGTDEPFERFGAPWIEGVRLAARLEGCGIPGVRFTPIEFTPAAGPYSGEVCGGVHVAITDRQKFNAVHAGLIIAWCLNRMYPASFEIAAVNDRLMNQRVWEGLMRAESPAEIAHLWRQDVADFKVLREPCLLYD